MKPFINPYPTIGNYNPTSTARLSADMPKQHYQFIQSIDPQRGSLQTTINLLWSKLTETLKSHGITDITHITEFREFVANCVITDGRHLSGSTTPTVSGLSTDCVVPNASASNDRRRAAGTPPAHKDVASKPRNPKSSAVSRSGTSRANKDKVTSPSDRP